MKKYLIAITLIVPFFVSAQTTSSSTVDLQEVIKQLQTQVEDLKTEVQSLKTELKFSRVLTQGATGDDVKQLQEFLRTFTGAYPEGLVTGYFGPITKAAVKKFQAQNGIEAVGIVGPKTQEKLGVLAAAIPAVPNATETQPSGQATTVATTQTIPHLETENQSTSSVSPQALASAVLCRTPLGTQVQQPASIKVLSPNGGEQWQIGGTYTIKYSAKDTVGNKALLIYLEKGYDAPSTKVGANSRLLIGVTTNLESYTYKIPQNTQFWPGLGSNYKITVMVEGSLSSCGDISYDGDSSDATFSIVAGQDITPGSTVTPSISASATIAPASISGGGYGVSTAPVPAGSIIVTTQEKIANIQSQISALQEKLITTTDTTTRDSVTAQIVALKKIVQELQNQIFQGKLLLVATPTASATTVTTTSGGGYGKENTSFSLTNQVLALQDKLHTTTDDATRASLIVQITELKRQSQVLEDKKNATAKQLMALQYQLYYANDATVRASLEAQITALGGQVQTLPTPTSQDQINALLEKINAYQDKLDKTTDTSARDSLTAQIATFKSQLQILQNNPPMTTKQTTTPMPLGPTTSSTSIPQTHAPTDKPIPATPFGDLTAEGLLKQINSLQGQLNITTDISKRDSLIKLISAMQAQVKILQSN